MGLSDGCIARDASSSIREASPSSARGAADWFGLLLLARKNDLPGRAEGVATDAERDIAAIDLDFPSSERAEAAMRVAACTVHQSVGNEHGGMYGYHTLSFSFARRQ